MQKTHLRFWSVPILSLCLMNPVDGAKPLSSVPTSRRRRRPIRPLAGRCGAPRNTRTPPTSPVIRSKRTAARQVSVSTTPPTPRATSSRRRTRRFSPRRARPTPRRSGPGATGRVRPASAGRPTDRFSRSSMPRRPVSSAGRRPAVEAIFFHAARGLGFLRRGLPVSAADPPGHRPGGGRTDPVD
jgi:hypothetical protein